MGLGANSLKLEGGGDYMTGMGHGLPGQKG